LEDLTGSQYATYISTKTSTLEDIVNDFASNPFYSYDEETQNALIDAAYAYSESVALEKASGGRYEETAKWITDAESREAGMSIADWIIAKKAQSAYTAWENGIDVDLFLQVKEEYSNTDAKDANGKTVSGLKKQRMVEYLNSLGLTSEEWDFFYHEVFGYKS
jgi:hypothetical protein